MAALVDLNVARKHLSDALGENIKQYWANMKLWYKQKISKEEFDMEARRLLTQDNVHFHNEFLLAILAKCQAMQTSPAQQKAGKFTPQQKSIMTKEAAAVVGTLPPGKLKKTKVKKKIKTPKGNFEHRFVPASPFMDLPETTIKSNHQESELVGFCARQMTLPDLGMLTGRLMVTAWECGLEQTQDEAVHLVLYATEHCLKDILSAVLTRRRAYRLRDGSFRYGMGSTTAQSCLRNAARRPTMSESATTVSISSGHIQGMRSTWEEGEQEAAMLAACHSSEEPPSLPPISLQDVVRGLEVNRSAVPSHTVYIFAMERALSRMWHPSHEELEQDDIHKREEKHRIEQQQRYLRI
ncbi:TADA1 [Branchiostoma lanceolatum]|uniref:Transcriptional adapter 1 n=1 Tax=Branchiostoma lanceolatum TaxID=7740 RepID=A0A8K0A8J2_BRALA|nr:TADA1 [Branchiostoma lanceolatum]